LRDEPKERLCSRLPRTVSPFGAFKTLTAINRDLEPGLGWTERGGNNLSSAKFTDRFNLLITQLISIISNMRGSIPSGYSDTEKRLEYTRTVVYL